MDAAIRILVAILAVLAAIVGAIVYAIAWTIYHFCYACYLAVAAPDHPSEPRFL